MSSIFLQKRTKEFDFTTMIPQIDLFSFVFWRKSKTPKNHFEIIWPLGIAVIFYFNFFFKIFQKLISVPLRLFRSLEYDPQSAGINVQSLQSESTPRGLTLHCAIWFSLFIKWSQFQADYWEILRKIDWSRECVETSQTWGARPAWRLWILVGKNILTKNYPLISLADYWEILRQTRGPRPAWKFWTLVGKKFNLELLGSWSAKY